MTLTRYWRFDDLAPCRLGVAYAMVHFALVAFTLLGFYLEETEAAQDTRTRNQSPLRYPYRSASWPSMSAPTSPCFCPVN